MSGDSVSATVLLPTTGEKGPVIQYALASVLSQSVASIEVFVVGDGAGASTRDVVRGLADRDPRVRFFDFPKGERRGETYRHDLLMNEARGQTVCYICDRDLWCRDHVAGLCAALAQADFAASLPVSVHGPAETQARLRRMKYDLRIAPHRRAYLAGHLSAGPLSGVAHTLVMYRRLPRGWETTPAGRSTDQYMWRKFLADDRCRFAYSPRPSALWFGECFWTEDAVRRAPALATWWERIERDDWLDRRSEMLASQIALGQVRHGLSFQAYVQWQRVARQVRKAARGIFLRNGRDPALAAGQP